MHPCYPLTELLEKLNQPWAVAGCYKLTICGQSRPDGLTPHPSDENFGPKPDPLRPFETSRCGDQIGPMIEIFDLMYAQSKTGYAPFEMAFLELNEKCIWSLDLCALRRPPANVQCEIIDI